MRHVVFRLTASKTREKELTGTRQTYMRKFENARLGAYQVFLSFHPKFSSLPADDGFHRNTRVLPKFSSYSRSRPPSPYIKAKSRV